MALPGQDAEPFPEKARRSPALMPQRALEFDPRIFPQTILLVAFFYRLPPISSSRIPHTDTPRSLAAPGANQRLCGIIPKPVIRLCRHHPQDIGSRMLWLIGQDLAIFYTLVGGLW